MPQTSSALITQGRVGSLVSHTSSCWHRLLKPCAPALGHSPYTTAKHVSGKQMTATAASRRRNTCTASRQYQPATWVSLHSPESNTISSQLRQGCKSRLPLRVFTAHSPCGQNALLHIPLLPSPYRGPVGHGSTHEPFQLLARANQLIRLHQASCDVILHSTHGRGILAIALFHGQS